MNRRNFIASTVFGVVLMAASVVNAKDAGWDGTWAGTTAKGGDIVVTVSGGRATYAFRGSSVPVNSAAMSGQTLTLTVGALNGVVRLSKSGADSASYSYSDSSGGSATATLKRR